MEEERVREIFQEEIIKYFQDKETHNNKPKVTYAEAVSVCAAITNQFPCPNGCNDTGPCKLK